MKYSGYNKWYQNESKPHEKAYLLKNKIPFPTQTRGQPKEELLDEYKNKIKITEYTNVHAYFILRTMLMWDLPVVFNIITTKGHDILNKIDDSMINKIKEEILKVRTNSEFVKLMNTAISNKITDNSLRMTIIEKH